MLDIGFMEILVIGALALIVVGPKELPGLLRTVGQYAGKARAMAREFQRTMEDAAREADLGDVAEAVKGKKNKLPFGNQVVDSLKEFEKTVKSEVSEAQRAGEAAVRSAPKPAVAATKPAAAGTEAKAAVTGAAASAGAAASTGAAATKDAAAPPAAGTDKPATKSEAGAAPAETPSAKSA